MAHLWIREPAGAWAVLPLRPGLWDLTREPPGLCDDPGHLVSDSCRDRVAFLCPSGSWILLSGMDARVRINGNRLISGARLLRDRDEIRVRSRHLYFSSETLAEKREYPGAHSSLYCPRCKQEIREGTEAVRCPRCRIWHHQSQELPCWTYARTCAVCDQPSGFGLGYTWTPEAL